MPFSYTTILLWVPFSSFFSYHHHNSRLVPVRFFLARTASYPVYSVTVPRRRKDTRACVQRLWLSGLGIFVDLQAFRAFLGAHGKITHIAILCHPSLPTDLLAVLLQKAVGIAPGPGIDPRVGPGIAQE